VSNRQSTRRRALPRHGCWSWPASPHHPDGRRPRIHDLRHTCAVNTRRWTIKKSFQAGKRLTGLDEHQVRRWTSWRRWTLLTMIAHALLVVIATNEHTDRAAPAGMIPLTCSEIRRLFTVLVITPRRVPACPHAWSSWRRRQKHRPEPATTGARRQLADGHHDLRLEY
jgi:hypothetical protein